MGKAIELSPLADVALRMYLSSVSRLDYKPDLEARRSMMEEAYREAAEFMEAGDSFVASVESPARLLSEWEIDLVKRQAVTRFGYNVGRAFSVMAALSSLFPDVYEAATQAGFSDPMDPAMVDRLCMFLKGEIDL